MSEPRILASCDIDAGSTGLAQQHQRLLREFLEPVVQRCADCTATRFPPLLICPECRSSKLDWCAAGHGGMARSWVTVHAPASTATISIPRVLLAHVPYATVVVELDDFPGVRIPTIYLGSSEDWQNAVPVDLGVHEMGNEVVPVCTVRDRVAADLHPANVSEWS